MALRLANGVSFCATNGRTIFLDVPGDRYFCLAPEAEQSFQRLAAGEDLNGNDRTNLNHLISSGLLVDSPHPVAIQGCDISLAEYAIDQSGASATAGTIARALWTIARASIAARFRSLNSNLDALRKRKFACDFGERPCTPELAEIAAAFATCSLLCSGLDQCLPRSLAAAHLMIDLSILPELVIGVRLQPFSAHCWVQHRDVVINDAVDRVRNYTPILVV